MDALAGFAALGEDGAFPSRHIGPDGAEVRAMLSEIGCKDLAELIARTLPQAIRSDHPLGLSPPIGEAAVMAELAGLAARNVVRKSLIGQGYHGTHMPAVIRRNVFENPGWYTAYTPYQPEIAQGRLEALLNFQTMIIALTGMEIANASLLDEGTAAAEAMAMAHALTRDAGRSFLIAGDVHPQTRAVLATRTRPRGITVHDVTAGDTRAIASAQPFAVLLQCPATDGAVRDLTAEIAAAHEAGALAVVAADPLALVALRPPGEMGADIVIGSAQRFGVPMGFGGPHAGFLATRETLRRQMPGRLVGVSVDAAGGPAMRLALQTREQHIRREKATSNICTAQVLLAVLAGFYAVWHGPDGLARIAARVQLAARLLADAAIRAGHALVHDAFFDTITLEPRGGADALIAKVLSAGFNLRRLDAKRVAIALDETVTEAELVALAAAIGAPLADVVGGIPPDLARASPTLTHEVFRAHRSEHAMLRYIRRLEEKDISLTRSMIPLGSCTMKLNAAAEMIPVSLPGFTEIHPFAPPDQAQGYAELIRRLSGQLAAITGFPAVSLQPNSGAQGELAGLLAIRAWQAANGESARDVCLIPESAHGTNPASATMAGLRVVVVACDRRGNIDPGDLRAKIACHAERLAALMVTYPSTHGVFEEGIREICELVHRAGGQVYMDGANMNAQLGLTSPAGIGADVCHLNLHKTFCIPHGGGGPGIGPIAVAVHLAPHLPNHPLCAAAGPATGYGPVASAPFGSAMILPISYAYIRMMGAAGLKRASEIAILNANYIATRLRPHYPVLYTGAHGTVAHECILDCRAFQDEAGVSVEDIAKRLQDFGFHAPTMSWPVAGTLMVEPTESETRGELDRFCEAMIAIREEIAAIAAGRFDRRDNPLKNAPHTAAELLADSWQHCYSRGQAAYPRPFVARAKFWPPVKRVDNVYGDRHLVCTCAPLEAYAEAAD
ncbi:MAG: aminomethyl-transferring glycine dehydrogenase [Acetobacteraceae bacterium]